MLQYQTFIARLFWNRSTYEGVYYKYSTLEIIKSYAIAISTIMLSSLLLLFSVQYKQNPKDRKNQTLQSEDLKPKVGYVI
jgi:hypothetical protein